MSSSRPRRAGLLRLGLVVSATMAISSLSSTVGCSSKSSKPSAVTASLSEGVVARVGSETIDASTVEQIAQAQSVDIRTALDRAIFDSLAAQEARSKALDKRTRRDINRVLARALLDQLADEARADGPPTDEEIQAISEKKWFEVARPEAYVVVHAVVRVPKDAPPAVWDDARAIASNIQKATLAAAEKARSTSPPDFMPKRGIPLPLDPAADLFVHSAQAVEHGSLEVVAEQLWPLGTDGKTVRPESREPYDPAFVNGVMTLRQRGDLTAPFDSSFGVHIVMLLDRLPGVSLTLSERRERFTPDMVVVRTRRRLDALLDAIPEQKSVSIERSVDALLTQVQVGQ
ncbi:MAG: hypothetical protein U0271_20640 [Polyangiaceae bacterium]